MVGVWRSRAEALLISVVYGGLRRLCDSKRDILIYIYHVYCLLPVFVQIPVNLLLFSISYLNITPEVICTNSIVLPSNTNT